MAVPILQVRDLEAGNAPLLAHAALHMPADADEVTFQVQYALGDQPREEFWSAPDTITVTRGGEIHGASSE